MKNKKKYLCMAAYICLAGVLFLMGCGKKNTEIKSRKTEGTKQEDCGSKDDSEDGQQKKVKIVDGRDNVEVSGSIEGLEYTSADGNIRITLPNESWICDSDTAESVSFSSEEGFLSVIRLEGTGAVTSSMFENEEDYVNYLKGTTPTLEGEVVSFEHEDVDGKAAFHAVYHYAGNSEFKYGISYAVSFGDYCYTVSARISSEDEELLKSVCDSVNNCQILE